jgi:hypothetical protein
MYQQRTQKEEDGCFYTSASHIGNQVSEETGHSYGQYPNRCVKIVNQYCCTGNINIPWVIKVRKNQSVWFCSWPDVKASSLFHNETLLSLSLPGAHTAG